MKILLDSGHRNNQYDFGATGNGLKESELALSICKKLKESLKQQGITVYMTRDTEADIISIDARYRKARELRVDLLLSVHINSANNTTAEGIEVLYKSQNKLAETVCNSMCSKTGAVSRGIKYRDDLGVLNGYDKAILVECGFISNKRESAKLSDSAYQDKLVEGIAEAILGHYSIHAKDTALINAVEDLISKGVPINAVAWNDMGRMNLQYSQALIEKISMALFKTSNYFDAIDAMHRTGIVSDYRTWTDKQFKRENLRQLIINASQYVMK